jgi:hypothetical protein
MGEGEDGRNYRRTETLTTRRTRRAIRLSLTLLETGASLPGFTEEEQHWLAVIGRSLAYLSLHAADLGDKDIGERAELLTSLGLSKEEVAPMVGSTAASIEVLLRKRRKKKKGGKSAATKKGK